LLLAAVTVGPLLAVRRPADFVGPYPSAVQTYDAEAAVLAGLALVLVVRACLDRSRDSHPFGLALLMAVLAGAMTWVHWRLVDADPVRLKWQGGIYLSTLYAAGDAAVTVPHRYRPLPCGFARLLESLTGEFLFACLAYRWFFTWWFLWVAHRLARLFLTPGRAVLTLAPVVVLYPMSVVHYWGQLTDPLSHALFMVSLIWLLQDRPAPLGASLALGVMAKETVVLLVVVYFACYWRRGVRTLAVTVCLGLACVAAYFAVRLPQGWRPGLMDVNGLDRLMIGPNLGVGDHPYHPAAPLWENYLHPILFVGVFLIPIAFGWRRLDRRLRVVCATLVPLLLASNVCFGWLYESRNYMPLVPLLATAALSVTAQPAEKDPTDGGRDPNEDA
jgi:hypothetical protein